MSRKKLEKFLRPSPLFSARAPSFRGKIGPGIAERGDAKIEGWIRDKQ
jgi:hypothetical protein